MIKIKELRIGKKEKMTITKKLFIETIMALKKQHIHDTKCAKKIKEVFPDAFEASLRYQNHYITNQLIKMLQVAFNDETEHSMIEYFLWELDFGKQNNKLSAYRKDKSKINLSTAGHLYDYLIEEMNTNG